MKSKILFLGLLICNAFMVKSQVSITGPSCVVAGVQYQYIINTPDTSGSGIHICVNGGSFATGDSCLNDSLVSAIYVTWQAGAQTLSISFTSNAGSALKSANLTTPLQPGVIDSAYAEQYINYNTAAPSIQCTAASGGGCNPTYSYQWQQSTDNVTWNDIDNLTTENFTGGFNLTQTSFFRRKVTETNSGTIGYSTVAAVYVPAAPPADSTGFTTAHFAVVWTNGFPAIPRLVLPNHIMLPSGNGWFMLPAVLPGNNIYSTTNAL